MKTALGAMCVFALLLVMMSPFAHADDKNEELLRASKNGDTDRVKALLGEGADANVKDMLGSPALLGAACAGHTETVKALLAAGADVNAKGALVHSTALICASSEGHTESVKALLAAGTDVNAKNEYGQTALYLAAQGCHTESLKVLLEAGADVNAETVNRVSAVGIAGLMGCPEAVELLKKAVAAEPMAEAPDRATAVVIRRRIKPPPEDQPEVVADTESEPPDEPEVAAAEAESEPPSAEEVPPVGNFTVNLASFRQKQKADRYVEELKKQGLDGFCWEVNLPEKGTWYRVSVGRFPTCGEAAHYMKKLKQEGISDTFITKIPES